MGMDHASLCALSSLVSRSRGDDELRPMEAASLFIIRHSAFIVRGTVLLVAAQREGG
jgi:hypothetical protein